MTADDIEFDEALEKTRSKIYEAFCDDINTPGVINEVDEAIRKTNIYFDLKSKKVTLLEKAYRIISQPFEVMGLEYATSKSSSSAEAVLTAITKFRD